MLARADALRHRALAARDDLHAVAPQRAARAEVDLPHRGARPRDAAEHGGRGRRGRAHEAHAVRERAAVADVDPGAAPTPR